MRFTPISIHPPRVGRDVLASSAQGRSKISIHPPRVGRDAGVYVREIAEPGFQSTLPVWGGTTALCLSCVEITISIHPPRVGRDQADKPGSDACKHFNPPSPCGEGLVLTLRDAFVQIFQSTLPVWGGTATFSITSFFPLFQSTLPVWGGTSAWANCFYSIKYFNPPSPCGEGQHGAGVKYSSSLFQSTLPVWGGT